MTHLSNPNTYFLWTASLHTLKVLKRNSSPLHGKVQTYLIRWFYYYLQVIHNSNLDVQYWFSIFPIRYFSYAQNVHSHAKMVFPTDNCKVCRIFSKWITYSSRYLQRTIYQLILEHRQGCSSSSQWRLQSSAIPS